MSETPKRPTLENWILRVKNQDMPIFGHTVQSILNVADDDHAPSAKLAQMVLQDASMTARVLKLANTIYYNPRTQGISTISRAIIVLGFTTVRNMCLSISLVDSLLTGNTRNRLTHELAQAIHAAVQARSLAIEMGDHSPEEIFIATLLLHIGDMAFWCFSGEQGDELDVLLDQPGYTAESAQQELLGFELNALSISLVEEWRLNPLLLETLTHPHRSGRRGRAITLSHTLAEVAEEKGWNSPEAKAVQLEMSKLSGLSEEKTVKMLHRNAVEASRIASYYGASAAAHTIPLPGNEKPPVIEVEAKVSYPEPDGMLQLKILRELSQILDKGSDFNLVMELVLEGIYRGIGCDRTLFALLTPDRRGIRGKFALGEGNEQLRTSFHFIRHPNQPNIFFHCLEQHMALWADTHASPELKRYISSAVTQHVGLKPFLLAPISIGDKPIGILYADRALSGRALDEESFESFQHFASQASMGLTLLTGRKS